MMMNFATKIKVFLLKNMTVLSEMPILWGGYRSVSSLRGGLAITHFLHDKYNSNDELCKKLEVSNFKNTTVISETPISWGGTPQFTP